VAFDPKRWQFSILEVASVAAMIASALLTAVAYALWE
jgi:hypothetical protein